MATSRWTPVKPVHSSATWTFVRLVEFSRFVRASNTSSIPNPSRYQWLPVS